jgi:bifunctional DNA-binding transcriptional regulator/antitoxin component of YhaV-PrlF toxin-antitoxin module
MQLSRIATKNGDVPVEVRQALGWRVGDMLVWEVGKGEVRLTKMDAEDWAFLKLAEQSLAEEWLGPEDTEAFRDL